MDTLPYYDLRGFLDRELVRLDGARVEKSSQVNGEEKSVEKTFSLQDWKEEFEVFYSADINSPALASSYSSETEGEFLVHRLLPEAKGKVKEIKIRYLEESPVSVTLQMAEKNLFFSSTTFGEFYLDQDAEKIDHYAIETNQKVWFLQPTHIKIVGVIK